MSNIIDNILLMGCIIVIAVLGIILVFSGLVGLIVGLVCGLGYGILAFFGTAILTVVMYVIYVKVKDNK